MEVALVEFHQLFLEEAGGQYGVKAFLWGPNWFSPLYPRSDCSGDADKEFLLNTDHLKRITSITSYVKAWLIVWWALFLGLHWEGILVHSRHLQTGSHHIRPRSLHSNSKVGAGRSTRAQGVLQPHRWLEGVHGPILTQFLLCPCF
jgi:hypothetical protein